MEKLAARVIRDILNQVLVSRHTVVYGCKLVCAPVNGYWCGLGDKVVSNFQIALVGEWRFDSVCDQLKSASKIYVRRMNGDSGVCILRACASW